MVAGRSWLFALVLMACGDVHAPLQVEGLAKSVVLDIPAREQAPESPDAGWCAETAIQEALLHYGAYVPQRVINRAGKPRHPDLYWDDVEVALSALSMRARRFAGDKNQRAFVSWVGDELRQGNPVFTGVKLYPTKTPQWGLDHMVLIVGADEESLHINTTWGTREHRTLAEVASTNKGISLANRYHRFFAYALMGFADTHPEAPPVRLVIATETAKHAEAFVELRGLEPGKSYALHRHEGGEESVTTTRFVAAAPHKRVGVQLRSDVATRFISERIESAATDRAVDAPRR